MKQLLVAIGLSFALGAGAALAGDTKSAEGAKVFFDGLADGATVSSPVMIKFGIEGM